MSARVAPETAEVSRSPADPPPSLSPAERADLALHVEAGRLVVQTPEETEEWYRRRWLEALMDDAMNDAAEVRNMAMLNAALAAAQGEFPPIPRDKEVTVQTRTGGTYTFKYAELGTILAAVRPVLAKHGLSITQPLADNGAGPNLITELRHADGALVRSKLKLAVDGDDGKPISPQALGSLLTYMRRYAIVAILGIAAEEDDDGNQAQDAAKGSAGPVSSTGKTRPAPQMITDAQHRKIGAQIKELTDSWPTEDTTTWADRLRERFGVRSRKELTQAKASEAIEWLDQHLAVIPELPAVDDLPFEPPDEMFNPMLGGQR